MPHAENLLDESEVRSFLSGLAFVREFSIKLVSLKPGSVTIELPFDERFSGPPNLFPASMVGTAGDVAAVASCLTLMPKGWALATLDFTVKFGFTESSAPTLALNVYSPATRRCFGLPMCKIALNSIH